MAHCELKDVEMVLPNVLEFAPDGRADAVAQWAEYASHVVDEWLAEKGLRIVEANTLIRMMAAFLTTYYLCSEHARRTGMANSADPFLDEALNFGGLISSAHSGIEVLPARERFPGFSPGVVPVEIRMGTHRYMMDAKTGTGLGSVH